MSTTLTPRQRGMLAAIAVGPVQAGNRRTRPVATALVAKGLARWTAYGLTITDAGRALVEQVQSHCEAFHVSHRVSAFTGTTLGVLASGLVEDFELQA